MKAQEKIDWEQEYQKGDWNRLHGDDEFVRYQVLASYVHRMQSGISLFDVGCGEGVLLRHLNLDFVASYTGLDIAQTALDRIGPRRRCDRYICSTLEHYLPDEKWDVILFNEVLYYTADPVAQLRKFEQSLKERGVFLISIYKKNNVFAYNNRCIRSLQRFFMRQAYCIQDAVEIRNLRKPARWQVFVVQPSRTRSSAPPS